MASLQLYLFNNLLMKFQFCVCSGSARVERSMALLYSKFHFYRSSTVFIFQLLLNLKVLLLILILKKNNQNLPLNYQFKNLTINYFILPISILNSNFKLSITPSIRRFHNLLFLITCKKKNL